MALASLLLLVDLRKILDGSGYRSKTVEVSVGVGLVEGVHEMHQGEVIEGDCMGCYGEHNLEVGMGDRRMPEEASLVERRRRVSWLRKTRTKGWTVPSAPLELADGRPPLGSFWMSIGGRTWGVSKLLARWPSA